ncbi:hypothetical protein MNB_SV-14-338 [hydrothermal vent metagenome]|uniref:Uncharacterized protein n=1 Tax=hydrothermal vent metagenome TaxID=652676 RepID=A0A1W1C3D0_9ZZZZ
MVLGSMLIHGEIRGIILNKDKLLTKVDENKTIKPPIENTIKQLLQRSKQVKELSKRYSQIAIFYKDQLLFKIQEKDFDKDVTDKNIKFIIHTLENIEKSIDKTKLIIVKDKKTIKKLEEQI